MVTFWIVYVTIVYAVPTTALLLLKTFSRKRTNVYRREAGKTVFYEKGIKGYAMALIPFYNIMLFTVNLTDGVNEFKEKAAEEKKKRKQEKRLRENPQLEVIVVLKNLIKNYKKLVEYMPVHSKLDKMDSLLKYVEYHSEKPEFRKVLLENEMMLAYLNSLLEQHTEILQDSEDRAFIKTSEMLHNFFELIDLLKNAQQKKDLEIKKDIQIKTKARIVDELELIDETMGIQKKINQLKN